MAEKLIEEKPAKKKQDQQPADQEAIIANLQNTIANQQASIAEQEAAIADQEAKIEDLKISNKKLALQLSANQREAVVVETSRRAKPTVKVDGTEYKFRFGAFAFEGTHYEAEDAALDNSLLRKILAVKGQSILKQLF